MEQMCGKLSYNGETHLHLPKATLQFNASCSEEEEEDPSSLLKRPCTNLKGEGHSKKRIFFVITNKKFILS